MNGEDEPSDRRPAGDGPGPQQWTTPGGAQYPAPPPSPGQGQYPPSGAQPGGPYPPSGQQPGGPYPSPGQEPGGPYPPSAPQSGPYQQAGEPYQYGQPGVPSQQPGAPGFTTPMPGAPPWGYGTQGVPPKKRRTGLIVGLSAVAAAVVLLAGVGVAAVELSSGHSGSKKLLHSDGLVSQTPSMAPSSGVPSIAPPGPQHTISVPTSVDGYDQVTGNVANRTIAAMRSAMAKAAPNYANMYQKAKIGLYGKSGTPTDRLIFMGMSSADEPELGPELQARSPSEEADTFLLGTGISNATDYPPGPFGGVLRCGHAPLSGVPMSSCVWVDGSTFGAVLMPQGSDDASTARVSLALRTAAEH